MHSPFTVIINVRRTNLTSVVCVGYRKVGGQAKGDGTNLTPQRPFGTIDGTKAGGQGRRDADCYRWYVPDESPRFFWLQWAQVETPVAPRTERRVSIGAGLSVQIALCPEGAFLLSACTAIVQVPSSVRLSRAWCSGAVQGARMGCPLPYLGLSFQKRESTAVRATCSFSRERASE